MVLYGEFFSFFSEFKLDMYKNVGIKFRDKMIVLKVGCLFISYEIVNGRFLVR